jgi:hypothetical protein
VALLQDDVVLDIYFLYSSSANLLVLVYSLALENTGFFFISILEKCN